MLSLRAPCELQSDKQPGTLAVQSANKRGHLKYKAAEKSTSNRLMLCVHNILHIAYQPLKYLENIIKFSLKQYMIYI